MIRPKGGKYVIREIPANRLTTDRAYRREPTEHIRRGSLSHGPDSCTWAKEPLWSRK